jgi:2-dehydro-3-deoxyphosphogluconate aldolase / (4S)-4-hydroxy-2-oxoglutarate aldolase
MKKSQVFDRLKSEKIIGIIRASKVDFAIEAARAAIESGMSAIELTFTTPDCEKAIIKIKQEFPDCLLGAGSIREIIEGEKALDCGADFFVSPHFDEELVKAFAEEAYIPGVLTPTEIAKAHSQGAELLKLFPAQNYGPEGLRTLLGPFPNQNFMITGGVSTSNAKSYLESGAHSIAVGGSLFSREILESESWDQLRLEVSRWLKILK